MSANQYLLVLAKQGKSFKPLKEKFYELGGFYNDIGYAFPAKNEQFLKQILEPLNVKIYSQPLSEGQTFESLKQAHTTLRFKEKLIKKELEIIHFKSKFGIEELNEEFIEALDLPDYKKQEILDLIHECEDLKRASQWAEGMEKAISITPKNGFSIKFINEMDKNYLLEDAEEMPRLINFIDEGTPKPFIRRGVVGMVVGAGGVGKTHFLTQLGLSMAVGTPFLKKYPIEKPGSVFIGLGENSEEDIHRLIRKTFKKMFFIDPQMSFEQSQELEKISSRISVMSFTGMQASFIKQEIPTSIFQLFLNELKTKEPEEGWSCIILDPISRFLGADAETDNASATQFIALLEKLTLELKGKPTVIFGHHMNKSGVSGTNTDQAAARGSSAITDGVRFQINLEKVFNGTGDKKIQEKDKISMRLVKSNFTAAIPDQILKKDQNGILEYCQENEQKNQPPQGHQSRLKS
jgi:hypothetical protein